MDKEDKGQTIHEIYRIARFVANCYKNVISLYTYVTHKYYIRLKIILGGMNLPVSEMNNGIREDLKIIEG